MARRSMLLIAAVLIAALGTAMIVLYVQGIDDRATEGQELVEVLTATAVIEAGETVSAAQEAGKFEAKQVRRDDMVAGALDSTESIADLVALGTVYPGEQIISDRFGTFGSVENLVIPDDKMAISVELTDFERVAGFVNPGSEVAIFGSAASPIRRLPDGTEQTLVVRHSHRPDPRAGDRRRAPRRSTSRTDHDRRRRASDRGRFRARS